MRSPLGAKRIIALSVFLALLVAVMAVALAINQFVSMRDSRAWVTHSHDVIDTTRELEAQLLTAESAQRGYLITRQDRFVPAFQEALQQVPRNLARLEAQVADNPQQAARARRLRDLADARVAVLQRGFGYARNGQTAELQGMIAQGPGFPLMAQFRGAIGELRNNESLILSQRLQNARRIDAMTSALGLALAGVALLALLVMVILLARANRRLTTAIAASEDARQAQAAADALAAALFANVPDYLMVLDVAEDGRFVIADLNPSFQTALRTTIEQVRGRAIEDLLPAPMAANLVSHYRRVLASDRPVLSRTQIPVPGGGPPLTWESILAPVQDEHGVSRRIIGSIRDITERVAAEERLRTSQRMEAIGQLTGGVAHDFNNLLQVIRGNIELLEPAMGSDARAARRLSSALHGVDRAAQLTRQLLAYARRQPLEPRPVNLARLVGDMGDMLRRTLGEAIEVETVVAGGLWNTVADPAQVESAILNLAINSRDAMPEGGRLTLELTNAVLDEAYVRKAGDVAAGQYVLLAVSDTGHGMTPQTAARVFEPFFTTKSEGQGTGLGLSMVYGFVKQSNGHVQIYSEPGQGTTVKIYLPRTREDVEPEPAAMSRTDDGEGQVILVVEDEEGVRTAAVGMLERLGYQCIEATDARAALAIVESSARIDLIFTDVIMPGDLKTRAFAEQARALRPHTPILFTSGYTQNAIVHQGRLDDGVHLLSKPYALDELARKIAELMGRGVLRDDGRAAAAPSS